MINQQQMANEVDEVERSLFVTNLDKRVTDELLYELCLQAGPIEQCTVSENRVSSSNWQRMGVIIFKHYNSVSYAKDIFKGTSLFDRELAMSRENFKNIYDPDNHGQASLRGLTQNHQYPMDRNIHDDYRDRRNYRPERNHYDRRDRSQPYNNSDYRRRHDDRHFRHHNRSHNY